MEIRRVGILGVGLIGASLARALRRSSPRLELWGWDPSPPRAADAGIERWATSAEQALEGADLAVLAAPIGAIIDLLPLAARCCAAQALVTDTGSTKLEIMRAARAAFSSPQGPHFVGGHPMAGSERSGAAASSPDLLRDAPYALCAGEEVPAAKRAALERLLASAGARIAWVQALEHDRIVARVSHLPQLAVVALASLLEEESSREPALVSLAGSGLRDLLRLASSPYPMWRDICRSNQPALGETVALLAERLRAMAGALEGEEMEHWFESARRFREDRLKGGA